MKSDKSTPEIVNQLEATYDRANRASGGVLGIVRRTAEQVGDKRVSQAAASIAYYALFSLFPLLLFLIVIVSFFVDTDQARVLVLDIVAQAFPDAQDVQELINGTVKAVFDLRGEIGIISLLGLLWSASAAFTTLAYNIDLAWAPRRQVRPPLLQRLIGIGMILILGALVLLALTLSTVLGFVVSMDLPIVEKLGIDGRFLTVIGSRSVSWLLTFVVILALYRWVPKAKVPWAAAILGALMATLVWQILNAGFTWYLTSGLVRYELVYGSLTTIIVLMFWMYLSMLVVLVGAHLAASVAYRSPPTQS
jgi:YihY family inner membrane protein